MDPRWGCLTMEVNDSAVNQDKEKLIDRRIRKENLIELCECRFQQVSIRNACNNLLVKAGDFTKKMKTTVNYPFYA